MQDEYPKREPFFANRVARMLTKSAAAQTIGPEACWLVTVVALQEDVIRYERPVTYWNGQLLPLLGSRSQQTLNVVRKRAVAAGWLHYEPGTKGKPGEYWATIPAPYDDLPDVSMDEGQSDSSQNLEGKSAFPTNNEGNDSDSSQNSGGKAEGKRKESGRKTQTFHTKDQRPLSKKKERALFDTKEGNQDGPKIKNSEQLESLIDAWNGLPKGIAPRVIKRGGSGVISGWKRVQKSKEAREPFSDIDRLMAAICEGKFLHGSGWFRFDWIFRKGQGEWNAIKILEGRYRSDSSNNRRDAGRYNPEGADDDFAQLAEKVQDFT